LIYLTVSNWRYSEAYFFCVFFNGTLDLLKYTNSQFFVYFKGEENLKTYQSFSDSRKAWIPNSGFNLSAYLKFIIKHYYNLPDIVVFCKNNVYPRHVSEENFVRLSQRNVYTPIVETSAWDLIRFPIAAISSVGDYLELNNSFYSRKKKGRFFSNFNHFFQFIFPYSPFDENILMTKPLDSNTLKNLELKAGLPVRKFNIVRYASSRIYFAGVFLVNKFFGVSSD
jgi:hypothetical protein